MTGEQLRDFFLSNRPISARLADTAPNTWTDYDRIEAIVYTKDKYGRVNVSAELISNGRGVRVKSGNIRPRRED